MHTCEQQKLDFVHAAFGSCSTRDVIIFLTDSERPDEERKIPLNAPAHCMILTNAFPSYTNMSSRYLVWPGGERMSLGDDHHGRSVIRSLRIQDCRGSGGGGVRGTRTEPEPLVPLATRTW